MQKNKKLSGFTLIELLVVVSIIGLLASISLVAVAKAREKARDARKISDIKQISNAINLYYQTYGQMPRNYNCYNWGTGVFSLCTGNSPGTSGACDAPAPEVPGGATNNYYPAAYNATMQDLVNAKILSKIPNSPGGSGYCYFDFGKGNRGAIIMTTLTSYPPSVDGLPPSCRPWTSNGATWCEQRASNEFCMCNDY